jgi:phage-related tail protein
MTDMKSGVATQSPPDRRELVDTVKDKAKDMTASVERVAGVAKEKAKEATEAAKEKVGEAATAAGELAVHVKDKVREWGVTAGEEARDAMQDVAKELTAVVRRYPIQSLIVGVGVGFLLARATMTRS